MTTAQFAKMINTLKNFGEFDGAFSYKGLNTFVEEFLINFNVDVNNPEDIESLKAMIPQYIKNEVDEFPDDLYRSAKKFAYFVEDANKLYGRPNTIDEELQQAQRFVYEKILDIVVKELEKVGR